MNKISKENDIKEVRLTIGVKEIATIVGETCNECYGVIGLTNVDSLKTRYIILKKENYVNGVNVLKNRNRYDIDIHLICSRGVKLTEVIREVKKRVAYVLKEEYGQLFSRINVFVEEIRDN